MSLHRVLLVFVTGVAVLDALATVLLLRNGNPVWAVLPAVATVVCVIVAAAGWLAVWWEDWE